MNAHALTAFGIASLGKPRAAQTVHSVIRGSRRHVVLVIPEGQDTGTYYEVSPDTHQRLLEGWSPERLELEPLDPSQVDEQDEDAEFRAYSAARKLERQQTPGRL